MQVNTRPMRLTNACQSSSCASSETDSFSRSNSAQSLEHILRVSGGGGSSSSEIDMSDYPILPSTPKPVDRSHSYRSMDSDSTKSIAIAAVHPVSNATAQPTYSNGAAAQEQRVVIGAGAVPVSDRSSGSFKWVVGLVKGSNASKKKEARIGQLLKAAAAAGGAVGGGQYCAADAGSHAFCSKAVLRGSPWKSGVYKH